jgi:hypothetical protein
MLWPRNPDGTDGKILWAIVRPCEYIDAHIDCCLRTEDSAGQNKIFDKGYASIYAYDLEDYLRLAAKFRSHSAAQKRRRLVARRRLRPALATGFI